MQEPEVAALQWAQARAAKPKGAYCGNRRKPLLKGTQARAESCAGGRAGGRLVARRRSACECLNLLGVLRAS